MKCIKISKKERQEIAHAIYSYLIWADTLKKGEEKKYIKILSKLQEEK